MDWYESLPSDLKLSMVKLSNGEIGWTKDDALRAIRVLEDWKYNIGSVEVWVAGEAGPMMSSALVYNWDLDLACKEPGSPRTAREFVETFHFPEDDRMFGKSKPLFNIYAKSTS